MYVLLAISLVLCKSVYQFHHAEYQFALIITFRNTVNNHVGQKAHTVYQGITVSSAMSIMQYLSLIWVYIQELALSCFLRALYLI